MRPIPLDMREEMAQDKFYHDCCLKDDHCSGKIEWHHVWTYAGHQINEIWAIVPACNYHHANVTMFKEKFEAVSLSRATKEDLQKFPRKNWVHLKKYLQL